MSIAAFKNSLIPKIKLFANVPIIEAEQIGDMPSGAHVTYKITTTYGKDKGQAEESGAMQQDQFVVSRVESFKRIISFSAYSMDNDESVELAQSIYDWFDFYGYDHLSAMGAVVIEKTNVTNRDAFVLEDYERRNGFDVTLRLTRTLQQNFDYIERVDAFEPHDPVDFYSGMIDVDYNYNNDGVIDVEYNPIIDAETENKTTDQAVRKAGSRVGQSEI